MLLLCDSVVTEPGGSIQLILSSATGRGPETLLFAACLHNVFIFIVIHFSVIKVIVLQNSFLLKFNKFLFVHSVIRHNIVACRWKPEYLNRNGRPLLDNGSVTRFLVSLSGWQTRSHDNSCLGRLFPRQRIKASCSLSCSLSSQKRILLQGWLTELTESEGSDEMRESKEDAGQKRSRTVKSEVVNL
jgi:hypothetical protein